MKKLATITIGVMLCAALAACSLGTSAPQTTDVQVAGETNTANPVAIETASATAQQNENNQMYLAYSQALENLLQNRVLPDDTQSDEQDSATPSRFAVYDVDGDGSDELILLNCTASTAGTTGYVFDYSAETATIATELLESTDLTFYDNGIVLSKWSHNQGLAGDFWPFNLLQYDASIDCYRPCGSVDAWDVTVSETNEQGESFPTAIDKSGTGRVYYIVENRDAENPSAVDETDYTAWLNGYIGNAKELQIPYLDLTEENIALLRSMK